MDVRPYRFHLFIGTDDAIVVPRLPRKISVPHRPDAFGANGFELIDDGTEAMRHPCPLMTAGCGMRRVMLIVRLCRRDAPVYCMCRDAPPGRLYDTYIVDDMYINGRFTRCERDNTVEVVRHDDPCIQRHIGTNARCFQPFIRNNRSRLRHANDPVPHTSKPWVTVPCTNRDEIGSESRIIPSAAACGGDTVFAGEFRNRFDHHEQDK